MVTLAPPIAAGVCSSGPEIGENARITAASEAFVDSFMRFKQALPAMPILAGERNGRFPIPHIYDPNVRPSQWSVWRTPPQPLVPAFVSGPTLEKHLRKSLILSQDDLWTLVQQPISAACLDEGAQASAPGLQSIHS